MQQVKGPAGSHSHMDLGVLTTVKEKSVQDIGKTDIRNEGAVRFHLVLTAQTVLTQVTQDGADTARHGGARL